MQKRDASASRSETTFVFAYGTNMHLGRIHERVSGAVAVHRGFLKQRRLAFHKRGLDGSGKADAVFTGNALDLVWGIIYSIPTRDKPALDAFESLGVGYDEEMLPVNTSKGIYRISTYIARPDAIDTNLQPFSWYHRFVLHGAIEHGLPADYVRAIQSVTTVADPDTDRHSNNTRLFSKK